MSGFREGGSQASAGRATASPALALTDADRRELLTLVPRLYGPFVPPYAALTLYERWVETGLSDLDRHRYRH